MPCGNEGTLAYAGTNVRETVFVEGSAPFSADFTTGCETKELGDFALGLAPTRVLLVEVVDLGLVDCSMTEAALVRGLVDNHCIVHVVTRVRENSDDGVGAVGKVVQSVGVVEGWADDGRLTRLQTVELVVCAVVDGCTRGTHGLLAHLALVHVTGGLVVVGEGRHVGDDGEDVGWCEFDV